MSLASSQYDVKLNGQGYLLVEESYRERAQQSFVPRFSTGDPALGDLSFWQFLAQTDFVSEGQEDFTLTSKYRQSAGWDIRDKKPRLARGIESVTLANTMPAISSASPFTLIDDFADGNYTANPVWTVASGTPSITGGQLRTANGDAIYTSLPKSYGTWEWKWTSVSGTLDTLLVAFAYGSGSSYFGAFYVQSTGMMYLVRNGTILGSGSAIDITSQKTIRVTRNTSGDMNLYSNGVLKITTTGSDITSATQFRVGSLAIAASTSDVDDIYYATDVTTGSVTATTDNSGTGSKFLNYNNSLHTCWKTADADFTFTTLVNSNLTNNQPAIVHINAKDICMWSRDGNISSKNVFLVAVIGGTVKAFNGTTEVFSSSVSMHGTCVMAISSTVLAVIGVTAERSGIPVVQVFHMDAGAWTVASSPSVTADGGTSGAVLGHAALDSAGALYFASIDLTSQSQAMPSEIYYITSTDLLATKPTITSITTLSDFVVRGIFNLAGSMYLGGARIRGTESFASVLQYPSTVVWESTKAITINPPTSTYNYTHGVVTFWKNLDNVVFLGMNDLDIFSPILQLDASGNVRECSAFVARQFNVTKPNVIALAEWNGNFYLLHSEDGTIKRTTTARGNLGSTFSACILEASRMGANTPLINKTLYSVTIELSSAMIASYPLTVIVNGTTVGTVASTDGTRKEITLSSELTSGSFVLKLSIPQDSTWTGYLKPPILKYIPSQFKKKAWTFMVRATKNLRLIDDTRETSTSTALFTAIKAAWASNTPIPFIDIDGNTFTVIVTDYDRRVPLINRKGGTDVEQLCAVELLEV